MKKIEESFTSLEHQINQYNQVEDRLKSMHHVLSEVTLSLLEEHRAGVNQFNVEGLYMKINTVQQLLFSTLIEMKEDNIFTADLLDNLELTLMSDSQEVK